MTLHLKMPNKINNLSPKISVIGVGGAGGNIINSMIKSGISGVSFLDVNTDSQALTHSQASETLQLGPSCTQGLGAGADPDIGRDSALEVENEIKDYLEDSNMVFITAGMGGGTGTGASPIIAKIAKELGILIVGVVTKPLDYEGKRRMQQAVDGIKELQKYVDNLIIIPNQNIFHLAKTDTTYTDAFKLANNVLIDGVKSIMDLMLKPGMINHDFADVKAVMSETGKVHMGTAISDEGDRAIKATEEAISNPLLEYNSMSGAKGVLVNITGGEDITLHEVDQAINLIKEQADENANLIWGLTKDENFSGKFKISVISTGIESESFIKNQIHDINVKEFNNFKENLEKDEQNMGFQKENTLDGNLEKNQTNFFVDLKNDAKSISQNEKIKELEEKAQEFKESKKDKQSIFSKFFGTKEKVLHEKRDSNILYDSRDVKLGVLENEKLQNDGPEILNQKNNETLGEKNIELEKSADEEISFDQKINANEDLNINIKQDNYEDDLLQIPAFLRRQAN